MQVGFQQEKVIVGAKKNIQGQQILHVWYITDKLIFRIRANQQQLFQGHHKAGGEYSTAAAY